MRFPAYPNYKPSGVEWLGDVPEHWKLISLKQISKRCAGGTPDRSNDSYWDEGTIPWINSGAVNQSLITEPSALITEEGYRNSSAKWVPKGALVMALAGQGKTKGMVAQTAIRTTCNQSMAAIVPDQSANTRYIYWFLVSQYEQIRNMAGGEARDGLNLDILGSIPCFKVPEFDQQAIAEFLDAETAKLDTLVAKKRELIEKLKEKRSALISRTVTRGLPPDAAHAAGLNPNPKLKPSGIEWLGEIPEHWEVSRIRFEATVVSKGTTPSTLGRDIIDEGIRFIKAENIHNGKVSPEPAFFIDEDTDRFLARSRLKADDILVVIAGATTGKAATMLGDLLPANTNQAVCFIRLKKSDYAPILAAWISTKFIHSRLPSSLQL